MTIPTDEPTLLRRLLQQTALFGELAPGELDGILQGTRRIGARTGATLFRAGEPCGGFHIVVYGGVKILQTTSGGAERVIRLISAGQSFGEAMMFLKKPYIATAITTEDSLLLHVDRAHVLAQLDANPGLARKMLASLSWGLYMLVGDMAAFTMRSSTQRLIGYLLREHSRAQSLSFHINVSKKVVASRLNLTPEHFSRILRELADQKLLTVRGRTFTILDLDGLRAWRLADEAAARRAR